MKQLILTLLILLTPHISLAGTGQIKAMMGLWGAPSAPSGLAYASYSVAVVTSDEQTTLNIAAPSGVADGDTLIAVVCGGDPAKPITPPSGWTEVDVSTAIKVWKKTASSEGSSYTFTVTTYNYSHALIIRVSGTAGTVQKSETLRATWDGTIDFPAPTVSSSGSVALWIFSRRTVNEASNMATISRGSLRYQNGSASAYTVSASFASEDNVAAGSPITAASGTVNADIHNKYGAVIWLTP